MEKVVINKDSCIGCGMCVSLLPEYLVFDEMGKADPVGKELTENDKPTALEAVDACPVQAVIVEEEK